MLTFGCAHLRLFFLSRCVCAEIIAGDVWDSGIVSDSASDNDRDSPRVLNLYAVHEVTYLREGMCPIGIMQS